VRCAICFMLECALIWLRSSSDCRAGYGVTLQQGVSALKELGLLETALSHDVPSSSHYIFDPKGNIVGFFGRSFSSSSEAGGRGASTKTKYNVHVRLKHTNARARAHTHSFPTYKHAGNMYIISTHKGTRVHRCTHKRVDGKRIVFAAHGAIHVNTSEVLVRDYREE
jgi:hypothetical protein